MLCGNAISQFCPIREDSSTRVLQAQSRTQWSNASIVLWLHIAHREYSLSAQYSCLEVSYWYNHLEITTTQNLAWSAANHPTLPVQTRRGTGISASRLWARHSSATTFSARFVRLHARHVPAMALLVPTGGVSHLFQKPVVRRRLMLPDCLLVILASRPRLCQNWIPSQDGYYNNERREDCDFWEVHIRG